MVQHRAHVRDVTDSLLGGIDVDLRRIIVGEAVRRTLRPAQVLYRTGEPGERLYLLIKGRVQLSRPSRTGREVLFDVLGPGDVLGLVCLLTRRAAYMGTAKTIDGGEAMVWERATVHRLSRQCPQLTANALTVALGFVAQFAERHEALVAGTAEERLARALSRLGADRGASLPAGIEVRIKNEDLAALADVSAFTASRVLQQWERDGAVRKHRGMVQIVNPDGLLPH
jgi:CRP-like cAMP-binding protein